MRLLRTLLCFVSALAQTRGVGEGVFAVLGSLVVSVPVAHSLRTAGIVPRAGQWFFRGWGGNNINTFFKRLDCLPGSFGLREHELFYHDI